MTSGKHIAYHRLLEAFDQPGCPICELALEDARKQMEWILYELVNDPGTRKKIVASLGFCPKHAELFIELGHPLGVSLIYLDVVEAAAAELDRLPRIARRAAKCLACAWTEQSEEQHLAVLAKHFDDEKLRERLLESRGICLPHVKRLLASLSPPCQGILKDALQAQFSELRAELKEIVRKSDYRYVEPWGPEGNAWIRAVRRLSGK